MTILLVCQLSQRNHGSEIQPSIRSCVRPSVRPCIRALEVVSACVRVCVLWARDAGQAREEVAAAAGGMASKKQKPTVMWGNLNDPQSKPHRHRKNQGEQIGDPRKEPLHECFRECLPEPFKYSKKDPEKEPFGSNRSRMPK